MNSKINTSIQFTKTSKDNIEYAISIYDYMNVNEFTLIKDGKEERGLSITFDTNECLNTLIQGLINLRNK